LLPPTPLYTLSLPDALPISIPPLGNQFIIALKDSSLVAFIGFQDLFNKAQRIQSSTGMAMESYIIVGIYYLVLVLILTFIVNRRSEEHTSELQSRFDLVCRL